MGGEGGGWGEEGGGWGEEGGGWGEEGGGGEEGGEGRREGRGEQHQQQHVNMFQIIRLKSSKLLISKLQWSLYNT